MKYAKAKQTQGTQGFFFIVMFHVIVFSGNKGVVKEHSEKFQVHISVKLTVTFCFIYLNRILILPYHLDTFF